MENPWAKEEQEASLKWMKEYYTMRLALKEMRCKHCNNEEFIPAQDYIDLKEKLETHKKTGVEKGLVQFI